MLYSLLNHDASSPGDTPAFSGEFKSLTTVGATQFEVLKAYYDLFPSSPATGNKIIIGSGTQQEVVGWTSKSRTGTSPNYRYWINVTPSLSLAHLAGEKFDFYTAYYSSPYPLTNTLAEDASYINNIDNNDMASLKVRLGLMTYTSSSSSNSSRYGGLIENQQSGTYFPERPPIQSDLPRYLEQRHFDLGPAWRLGQGVEHPDDPRTEI